MVFPPEVTKQLGHYVYLYIDPFTDELFYIGKGVGNRAFQHLSETAESEKIARINEIRHQGKEPMIEILRLSKRRPSISLAPSS